MASSQNQGNSISPGLKKAALVSAVLGGGALGVDYATSLQINPLIGGVIGSLLGALLSKWLIYIKEDPAREIENFFTGVGILAGTIAGVVIGLSHFGGPAGFFGGLIVGAIVGAMAGQFIATLISISAASLLFISRGPVGLFLRKVVLSHNDEVGQLLDQLDQLDQARDTLLGLLAHFITLS